MANAVGDEWDGAEVRHVTAGGELTGNDEMWEETFRLWDRAGVPDEMILLAPSAPGKGWRSKGTSDSDAQEALGFVHAASAGRTASVDA
jgi:hypothetical protein